MTVAPAASSAKPGRRDTPEPTRVAPRLSPRRNINPSARRRAVALVSLVIGLVLAMLVGAFLIGRPTRVRVPSLIGLTRAQAVGALRPEHLTAALTSRYDARTPAGRVVGQLPAARRQLDAGATVRVVLSAGPQPVRLPPLTGESAQAAEAKLAGLGLTAVPTQVPAPGQTPGTVTWQSPTAGRYVPAHSSVRLHVAEAPTWRTAANFAGSDAGRSGPFTIRGSRWRVVYSMSYVGTCTFIVFCDGPTAHVRPLSGAPGANFDLSEGSGQSQTFDWGPGTYHIEITPGSDTAQWSFTIQDWY